MLRPLLAAALLALTPSCITLDEEKPAAPDEPVRLYSGSQALRGVEVSDVLESTERVRATGPLDAESFVRVSRFARPAVVSIYVDVAQKARVRLLPFQIPGFGIPVSLPGQGLGSGFIVHRDGYVLTNAHVIRNSKNIRILTYGGDDLGVEVLAVDPVYDVALLKIVGVQGPFPVLPMGDSRRVDVGSWSVAVGNPLGLGHSVTHGIVSQTNRHLSGVDPEEGREICYIQMDTPINPGNSGGPLVTLTGAWVGMNTAGFTEANNIAFAVPSEQVVEFIEAVIEGDGVERGTY